MSDSEEKRKRVIEKLRRELGPIVVDALEDPNVIEVMLNPDGTLWIERLGKKMTESGQISRANAEAALATLASVLNTAITRDAPVLEGELPILGARFEGVSYPLVPFPTFCIRKKATKIYTLADYVAHGIMSTGQRDALVDAVRARRNIVVVGGTGSGKTTLTNALIRIAAEVCPDDRFIIIEDTTEIQCTARNAVQMRTSPEADMRKLVGRVALRMRPDRILVGEVRGGEALELLKSWNTGHPGGIATIHADSAVLGLNRLEQLVAEVSLSPMPHVIATAVNVVVGIKKRAGSRYIEGVYRVCGYRHGEYITEALASDTSTVTPFPAPENVPLRASNL